MERPFVNNVEGFINEFVQSIGGHLVIYKLNQKLDFDNADYIFEKENILIELKCLEKDLFSDKDYERNERLLDKWMTDGIIRKVDIIPIMLGKKQLPTECSDELLQLCRNTFQTIIKKANRQLRETKKKIGNTKTENVLLICNDGNYFLSDIAMYEVMNHVLASIPELEIDCFVLFTVNQTSRVPDNDIDWSFWAPSYNTKATDQLNAFINDFGKYFYDFYNSKFGLVNSEHIEYDNVNTGLEAIKKQKHIPKEIIYKKK